MTHPVITNMARAIRDEIGRQIHAHPIPDDVNPDSWTATGGEIDLEAVARVALSLLIPHIEIAPGVIDKVRELSTAQLKYMWDDPHRTGRWDALCDEIHAVMNERGEGAYVAV